MSKNPGQLQLAFNETAEKKNKLTSLKMDLKHSLENNPQWTKAEEQRKSAARLAKIERLKTEETESKLMDAIDAAKADLKGHQEKLSMIAIKNYTEGKKVEVTDDDGTVYDPEFKVKFTKRK